MVAVDTSAIVAIGLTEPERQAFLDVLRSASPALISTVSAAEAHGRRGHRAVVFVDDLFALPIFKITAPGAADMGTAYAAFVAFGRAMFSPTLWQRCEICHCRSKGATSPRPIFARQYGLSAGRISDRSSVQATMIASAPSV
jgi:uncharacterized protein with PIN domain